jgi:hypothetical protein
MPLSVKRGGRSCLALGLVPSDQLEHPRLSDAILGGDLADRSVLDHHGGDQQSVQCHARTLVGPGGLLRDVLNQDTVSPTDVFAVMMAGLPGPDGSWRKSPVG